MGYIKGSVLTRVIDKRRPIKTPVLDTHFSETEQFSTNIVSYDEIDGPEGLMIAVSPGTASPRAPEQSGEEKLVTIPRFTEHDLVKPSDVLNKRMPGTSDKSDTVQRHYNNKLDAMKRRIDRTKEFMAIKALQGQVVDGAGRKLAEYGVPTPVAADFATDDPLDVFDDGTEAIAKHLGFDPDGLIVYAGPTAFKKLRASDKVRELLNGPERQSMLENGQLRKVDGVNIRRLPFQYKLKNGTFQPYIPPNRMILAPTTGFGVRVHGPIETPEALLVQEWLVETEIKRDPAGQKVRVETSCLPIVTRPQVIYIIDVA